MNNFSKIKNICGIINTELNSIEFEGDNFGKCFSQGISGENFSFTSSSKAVVKGYYYYISAIASSLNRIEEELSNIPSIILEADKVNSTESIILCDNILKEYEKFKSNINDYIKKCERLISDSHGTPSDIKMNSYFCDLTYKIDFFHKYVNDAMN